MMFLMSNVHSVPIERIQRRISLSGLTREAVAVEAGIHPSVLSRVLRGLRPPPRDFESRVNAAIDRLVAAERAAQEARERVLAERRAA